MIQIGPFLLVLQFRNFGFTASSYIPDNWGLQVNNDKKLVKKENNLLGSDSVCMDNIDDFNV